MEQLILKYLQGKLSQSDEAQLRQWLQEDGENRKVFENIVGNWHVSPNDLSIARKRILTRIKEEHRTDIPSHGRAIWKYAAAAILFIGLGITMLLNLQTEEEDLPTQTIALVEKQTNNGQKLTFELPDGTMVKLNAGSQLTFPQIFSNERREVELVGEAFFDVKRDVSKPFRITTGKVNVQVLGTSFNVKSYADDREVAVAVKTGKVSVESKSRGEKLILEQNELALYRNDERTLSKYVMTESGSAFGWTNNELVFENQSVSEILTLVSRWYGVEINYDKAQAADRKFTGRYNNPTLNQVMASLSFAFDFNYEIDENTVTIN